MKCVVTGAAGFIGSSLCEQLLAAGHPVTGLDCFTSFYSAELKRRNLSKAVQLPGFRFLELDLRSAAIEEVVAGADAVFHLAAAPGLVQNWAEFDGYLSCNVLATQRLLEALRAASGSRCRLVYASTSSVYGAHASGDETLPTRPVSPYGVTKLASENLCRAYAEIYGLPVVVLRYFSVYGPRQRPDMGYHKFIRALLLNEPITIFGDGRQIRGNTYVEDCVEATIAAVEAPAGETFNVGGGETADVWQIIQLLETISGQKAMIRQLPARPGDQRDTCADTSRIRKQLGWQPRTRLAEGLARQWSWQQKELSGGEYFPPNEK